MGIVQNKGKRLLTGVAFTAGLAILLLVVAILNMADYFASFERHNAPLIDFATLSLEDGKVLNVGKYEVGVDQWRTCEHEGYCRKLDASVYQNSGHPVTKVNWLDTQNFIMWMRSKTGRELRLPTYDEWMQIAANHKPVQRKKLFTDPRLSWAANYDITAKPTVKISRPAGEFGLNSLGLSDFKGNVWEWTSTECGSDEAPFLDECRAGRVVMGEHLAVMSDLVSDPGNASCSVGQPPANLGFRLVYEG